MTQPASGTSNGAIGGSASKTISPAKTTQSLSKPSSGSSYKALLFMTLLALQFGVQPIVTKRYTSQKIIKSTVIFMQEAVKLVVAVLGISLGGRGSWKKVTEGWTISSWLRLSLLPATIYLVQNMCSLLAYQNLDAITYNVLNQTKTLSAALCCYLLMRKKQSLVQMVALLLLLMAALVMEGVLPLDVLTPTYWMRQQHSKSSNINDARSESDSNLIFSFSSRHFSHGVIPILIASFLSGLAGAITQKSLQVGNRNALLFTTELCVASLLLLLLSFVTSEDGHQIRQRGFFDEWTLFTVIPILTNAAGGIFVGLVIKYAGTVRKGFALIFGILISGMLQSMVDQNKTLTKEEVVGGILAAVSLWMHATNPYVASPSLRQTSVSKTASIQETTQATYSRSSGARAVASNSKYGGRKTRKED